MARVRSLTWLALAVATGLPVFAILAGGDGAGSTPSARAQSAGQKAATGARKVSAAEVVGALPPGVSTRERGDGWGFADERGMTLYTYDRDEGTPGESACNDACAVAWPPLTAAPGAQPLQDWTLITRKDGAAQWAYRGRPVYRYAADAFPGATFGDGVDTVWRIAFRSIPLPREVGLAKTVLGEVLTDARGLTLYASEGDAPGKTPACKGECLETWQPLAAPWLAQAFADWTPVVRDDGTRQWAYKGRPLYRHVVGDYAPGEVTGNGVDGWSAIVLEPAPPLPPWATIQPSDAGELVANEAGLTVYAHGANARGQRRNQVNVKCPDGTCIDPQWVPFIAGAGAKPIGSWTLVKLPDGRQQWAYKGNKIYTNSLDRAPGEFKGIRFGGDRSWSAIMRSGEPMQGVSVGG
jgi:predicted lipoprotein with Yx(FWY)xxD motif